VTKERNRLYYWELALMVGVGLALVACLWLDRSQSELSREVIRLHVLANSDREEDQALKLQVRDAVLAAADGMIPDGAGRAEAETILSGALDQLARAGAAVVEEQGYDYPVTASLEEQVWFPTKEYADFAFPAGQYTALRVVIGEGAGQNWWCVVFPPLCLATVSEQTADSLGDALSSRQVALITGEEQGYVVKFRAIEWWEGVKRWASGGAGA